MKTKPLFLLLGLLPACLATERATYNSAGGLTALIANGTELPVRGELRVDLGEGVIATLQPSDQKAITTRAGTAPQWSGHTTFSNDNQAAYTVAWTESDAGVSLEGTATADPIFPGPLAARFPLDIATVDYVIDLPRESFLGGKIEPAGAALPATQPADPTFFRGTTGALRFVDAQANWTLTLSLDQPRPVTVADRWDPDGRSYRVTIQLHQGPWMPGQPLKFGLALKLSGTPAPVAARLTIRPAERLYPFDGFGGNYRIFADSPVTDYTLKNLHLAWARLSFNAILWDHERANPGPMSIRDGEFAQRLQRQGVPWILSLWFLPERYYTDPHQRPFGAFARQIAPDRWPEFLDLLGSYLAYLKEHYGAEPDLFSFNEPDLGVNVGFTPATHRDAIKRIGAYLAAHGFKTKLLLGDTANPRGSHEYVLAAAADPEAMRFVGAVSVHSWGNGTPAQYAAWGDVAAWVRRPLLVAEAGVDPGAWHNKIYDSYAYGLQEARQFQELLRYARPQALIYWQFTDDYGLVRVQPDRTVEPTGRFWLMKQFANLTPDHSDVVATASNQPGVTISAFTRGEAFAVHLLNTGPECTATVTGLPPGTWARVTTTETAGFQEATAAADESPAPLALQLPARSLTTLVRK